MESTNIRLLSFKGKYLSDDLSDDFILDKTQHTMVLGWHDNDKPPCFHVRGMSTNNKNNNEERKKNTLLEPLCIPTVQTGRAH